MSSDHYRAAVLLSMDRLAPSRPLLDLIASMDGDHYRHLVLSAMREQGIPPEWWVPFLETVRTYHGDHHQAALLTAAVPDLPADPVSVAAFVDTTAGLTSDHHKARVVESLLDRQDLDEANLRDLLTLVRDRISSTHHRAPLVEEIAGRLLQGPAHTE